MAASPADKPGGFIHPPAIQSPAPSTSTNAASSIHSSTLPTPRAHPLKPGSPKETAFIQHIDHGIQQITRRYAKKFTAEPDPAAAPSTPAGTPRAAVGETERAHEAGVRSSSSSSSSADTNPPGYTTFQSAGHDIERLVDLVWVSGTPSLQVPYLLSLALLTATYLPSFPPAPRTMLRLLGKLDVAFAGLLAGRDVESGVVLPGFGGSGGGRGAVSGTERVRVKGIVERTRVVVVEVVHRGEFEYEEEDLERRESEGEADSDSDMDVDGYEDRGGDWDAEVAMVYERTIVELGDTMGGPFIGITDG